MLYQILFHYRLLQAIEYSAIQWVFVVYMFLKYVSILILDSFPLWVFAIC